MARISRSLTILPNYSVHKIWRGHNKEWNIETNQDKDKYLEYLNEDLESDRFDGNSELQAACLMSNHTHEISKIYKPKKFSDHMRRHHSRYGMYFNRLRSRSGKVAQDRPKTCLIADEEHEMRAVFYIHANPIRANLVRDARDYHYSTHKLYAFGFRASWMKNIKFPQWYLRLGKNIEDRQKKYRKLFAAYLRAEGSSKLKFLNNLFYGPALWIEENNLRISNLRQQIIAPP